MMELFKRFRSGKETSEAKNLNAEAMLSFRLCQSDPHLAKAFFEREHAVSDSLFLDNMKGLMKLNPDTTHSLEAEVLLLKSCLNLYKKVFDKELFAIFEEKGTANKTLPALILFPLLLNALQYGYNSMEERPIKLKVTAIGESVQLEVSNRVNHHLESQEHTLMMDLYKQRLAYYYPDKHSLFCNSNSTTFKATLQIKP